MARTSSSLTDTRTHIHTHTQFWTTVFSKLFTVKHVIGHIIGMWGRNVCVWGRRAGLNPLPPGFTDGAWLIPSLPTTSFPPRVSWHTCIVTRQVSAVTETKMSCPKTLEQSYLGLNQGIISWRSTQQNCSSALNTNLNQYRNSPQTVHLTVA